MDAGGVISVGMRTASMSTKADKTNRTSNGTSRSGTRLVKGIGVITGWLAWLMRLPAVLYGVMMQLSRLPAKLFHVCHTMQLVRLPAKLLYVCHTMQLIRLPAKFLYVCHMMQLIRLPAELLYVSQMMQLISDPPPCRPQRKWRNHLRRHMWIHSSKRSSRN